MNKPLAVVSLRRAKDDPLQKPILIVSVDKNEWSSEEDAKTFADTLTEWAKHRFTGRPFEEYVFQSELDYVVERLVRLDQRFVHHCGAWADADRLKQERLARRIERYGKLGIRY